jgi:hypothetical protein
MAGRGEDRDVLHRQVQTVILSALASGEDDVFELMGAVAPYDVGHHFTPDVALLEIAAAALGLACPPGSEPLEYEGLTDRYLSDQTLTGRTLRHRTQYAIYAAACVRGGLLPDLLRKPVAGSRGCGRTPPPRLSSTAAPPRTASGQRSPRSP